ncbi:hypothetical protein F7R12_09790 [Pseudomonas tolaasii]|nr:hypothetical protein F7R12_09790 [Pseudomonas tolaasii]
MRGDTAEGEDSLYHCRRAHRLRENARQPNIAQLKWAGDNCGSWLACDSGLSVEACVADPPLSQASQLPQEDSVVG